MVGALRAFGCSSRGSGLGWCASRVWLFFAGLRTRLVRFARLAVLRGAQDMVGGLRAFGCPSRGSGLGGGASRVWLFFAGRRMSWGAFGSVGVLLRDPGWGVEPV